MLKWFDAVNEVANVLFFFFNVYFIFFVLGLEYYLLFPSWTGHTLTFQGTSAKVKCCGASWRCGAQLAFMAVFLWG